MSENTKEFNNILSCDEDETIKSNSLNSYLPLRRSEFEDEKEFNRYIKSVERLVRSSVEYREFITFTRESLGANVCSFTGETEEETGDIEIHHYPLTLFDIVKSIIDDFIYNNKDFNSFDIANEVIKLHFQLKIGFIPLAGTLHKKYHKGNLQIPIEYTLGDYEYLKNNTEMDPALTNKIDSAKKITIENVGKLEWNSKVVNSSSSTIDENKIVVEKIITKSEETDEEKKESIINLEDLIKR